MNSVLTKQKFRHFIIAILLVPLSILLSSCGGLSNVSPDDKDLSVLFGYIDMKEAPSGLGFVKVKRHKPTPNVWYSFYPEEGLFSHIGVKNGSYQVDTFGESNVGFANINYTYNFGGDGRNATARVIKAPGVYFLGAYKYKRLTKGSFLSPGSFEMQPIKSPTEKELLTQLLKNIKEDEDRMMYRHQIRRIEQYLKQLK